MARIRRFRVGFKELHALLNRWSGQEIRVPESNQLPIGAKIHHIFHDPKDFFITVVVEHESFDEVGDGEIPPGEDYINTRYQLLSVVTDTYLAIPAWYTVDQLEKMREKLDEMIYDKEQIPNA